MDVNEELTFLRKFKKNGGLGGRVGLGGGQGGCDRRIEVFRKIQKQNVGGSGGGVGLVGGQCGCVRKIEVFVKIQKIYIFFFGGGGSGGGRVRGSGWM